MQKLMIMTRKLMTMAIPENKEGCLQIIHNYTLIIIIWEGCYMFVNMTHTEPHQSPTHLFLLAFEPSINGKLYTLEFA